MQVDASHLELTYQDFFRALAVLEIQWSDPVGGCGTALQTVRSFVRKNALPPILYDLIRFGEFVQRLKESEMRSRHSVTAITPVLNAPSVYLRTEYPILAYVGGSLQDPFTLSPRRCHYLMVRGRLAGEPVTLIEIVDKSFIDALKRGDALEVLLTAGANIPRRLGWLQSLWKLGLIDWKRAAKSDDSPRLRRVAEVSPARSSTAGN